MTRTGWSVGEDGTEGAMDEGAEVSEGGGKRLAEEQEREVDNEGEEADGIDKAQSSKKRAVMSEKSPIVEEVLEESRAHVGPSDEVKKDHDVDATVREDKAGARDSEKLGEGAKFTVEADHESAAALASLSGAVDPSAVSEAVRTRNENPGDERDADVQEDDNAQHIDEAEAEPKDRLAELTGLDGYLLEMFKREVSGMTNAIRKKSILSNRKKEKIEPKPPEPVKQDPPPNRRDSLKRGK